MTLDELQDALIARADECLSHESCTNESCQHCNNQGSLCVECAFEVAESAIAEAVAEKRAAILRIIKTTERVQDQMGLTCWNESRAAVIAAIEKSG